MELPDIIGSCLGDAKLILARNSLKTDEIVVTQAPRKTKCNSIEQSDVSRTGPDFSDGSRVIRAELDGKGKVRLLVCNIENIAEVKGT